MPWWLWLTAGTLLVYVAAVGGLVVAGRRTQARALAGFVPANILLFRRLLRDPAVPRRSKLMLGVALAYLVMPFDLVPDFIPVAGQLDDVIVILLVLRWLRRASSPRASS